MARAGLGEILAQCSKIEHEAGLESAMELARLQSPRVTFLLLEPERDRMFAEGPMDFEARGRVLELGYETTIRQLDLLAPLFQTFRQSASGADRAPLRASR